jgi:hypothetical protein
MAEVYGTSYHSNRPWTNRNGNHLNESNLEPPRESHCWIRCLDSSSGAWPQQSQEFPEFPEHRTTWSYYVHCTSLNRSDFSIDLVADFPTQQVTADSPIWIHHSTMGMTWFFFFSSETCTDSLGSSGSLHLNFQPVPSWDFSRRYRQPQLINDRLGFFCTFPMKRFYNERQFTMKVEPWWIIPDRKSPSPRRAG